MKKQLYQVKCITMASSWHCYVVAKNQDDAVEKAKKEYRYASCYLSDELGEVIL